MNTIENESTRPSATEAEGVTPGHAEAAVIGELHAHEFESKDNSQPAVVADFAGAKASTNRAAANLKVGLGNNNSFFNLPLTAAGKFTVSAAEVIEQLSKRTDDEIDAIARQADTAEVQGVQLSLYGRAWVGACYWERRRRNSEMKKKHFKTIPLETWCKSVGLRSPKSAKRWAENFQTVLDTSTALKCVVAFAGIDLFLPRVAEALRILNAQLAGREPSTAELPILLAWLKERIKKKKDPPPPNEHKDAVVRPDSIPINDDPYADEVLVEIPESEEEVRLYERRLSNILLCMTHCCGLTLLFLPTRPWRRELRNSSALHQPMSGSCSARPGANCAGALPNAKRAYRANTKWTPVRASPSRT